MSFEKAFEKWLGGHEVDAEEEEEEQFSDASSDQEMEEGMSDTDREDGGKRESDLSSADEDDCGGMPVIERMAWQEEDLKGMPVLQRMDLPSKNGAQAARSPPPPPLQISLSLKRCSQEGRKSKSSSQRYRVETSVRGKYEDGVGVKNNYSSQDSVDDEPFAEGKSLKSKDYQHVKLKREKHKRHSKSAHRKHHDLAVKLPKDDLNGVISSDLPHLTTLDSAYSPGPGGDAPSHLAEKDQDRQGCPALIDEGGKMCVHGVSAGEVRRTTVLSPDRGLVEPDSTSEIPGSHSRTNPQQADSDVDMDKDSVSLSSGSSNCVHGGRSEVSVRVEEGLGECDSTSMFLTSPSAISPASQGEIEERVCPVLTDHEEGSSCVSRWSPGHCICQCRSFPPPTDLISPTATITSSGSSDAKSCKSLVNFCCDSAPHLERMSTNLEENLEPPVLDDNHRQSPPLLSLPGVDMDVKSTAVKKEGDFTEQQADAECFLDAEHHEAPPSLTRYETGTKLNDESMPYSDAKYHDNPPVLGLPEIPAEHVPTVTVKVENMQDRYSKMVEFTPDIKWESAVATVETKPSPNQGAEGESKPGIVIKIRTKGASPSLLTVPEIEPTQSVKSGLLAVSKVEPIAVESLEQQPKCVRKKRHTIDSPEMARRLRKRRRTNEEEEKSHPPVKEEQGRKDAAHVGSCHTQGRRARVGQNSNCPCCSHPSPKHKRRRRNTVTLGGDLTSSVAHLPPAEQEFVLSSSKLFRLQTRAHTLVCTLFPRLAPLLVNVTPESQRFEKFIDDVIGSLQRSELEENSKDSLELSRLLEDLTLGTTREEERVPVFSPSVVLCNSPCHALEDFQEKLCQMLQLLLPDLTISLTDNLFHSSEELELMLDKVISANRFKAAKKLM